MNRKPSVLWKHSLRWMGIFLLAGGVSTATAQSLSFEPPQEMKDRTASAGTTQLIIYSSSPNLSLSHEMGTEKAQRFEAGAKMFRYELVHTLNEDEMDYGGFCKTTFTLALPEGSQKFPLTMYAGKCYVGRFQPAGITCMENAGGVFPQAGKAKVTFSSALKDLSIWCDGQLFCDRCKQVAGAQASDAQGSVAAARVPKGTLQAYELVFVLPPAAEAALTPAFRVKSAESGIVDVRFDHQLEARKSYLISVAKSVKTEIRTYTYAELKSIAEGYLKDYAKQSLSSYFEAASNAIDEMLGHKDCPLAVRDSLLNEQYKMKYLRKYSLFEDKAKQKKEESAQTNGYEHVDTYKWLAAQRKFCHNIVETYPEMSFFVGRLAELDQELLAHPGSKRAVQTTVHRDYQVITGRVTKDDSFIGGVVGVKIYGTDLAKGRMTKVDDMTEVGSVKGDGTYEAILKRPFHYLYFYGERASRPITPQTEKLDVILTRKVE